MKMHKKVMIFILSFILLSPLAPFQTVKQAHAIEDAIIAIVNDELITLRDLKDYIRSTYVGLIAEGIPDNQIRDIMLDLEINGLQKLIEDKLILSEAKSIGLKIRPELIEERVEEVKQRYRSENEFLEALVQHGVTITDMRNKIIEQLKIKFIVDHKIRNTIYVNPQEITEYYTQHSSRFKKGEQIVLDSIFIPFSPSQEDSQVREIANTVYDLLVNQKQPFNEVAAKYSQAPSIGKVDRGQLKPDLEKVVFDLDEGMISAPYKMDNGYYIFKMNKKTTADIMPLESAKDLIKQRLYNEKFQSRLVEWIDELKENAYIEIKK